MKTENGLYLRLVLPGEEQRGMDLLNQGKAYMLEQNLQQWDDSYPALSDVLGDIETQKGWFLCDGEQTIAYFCATDGEEDVYQVIDGGQWLTQGSKYLTIHRLAFDAAYRGKGLASAVFSLSEEIAREKNAKSIRVDTHGDNKIMQRVITRSGFTYCGVVYYDGSPRVAFEKLL